MKMIYMDYAAATPMAAEVIEAMQPFMTERFYNPSATYLEARSVAKDLTGAREKVAHWLGARPSEIIFTAGGTEANNLAIHGIMRRYPDAKLVVSSVEHDSVLEPARAYDNSEVPVKPDGRVDIDGMAGFINDDTVLVSVMYANNEIGSLQPLRRLSRLIEDIRQDRRQRGVELPLLFHTDACQAAQYLDLHVSRLGVDMMTINGGKIYGPKQSGVLYVKAGIELEPQVLGGGQEWGMRSGTENVAGIVGLAAALDLVQSSRLVEGERMAGLQKKFIDLIKNQLPEAVINGSLNHRLPNNVHVTFPGQDNERLMMALDERGIMTAVGSACSASKDEPSHVLAAIGLDDSSARASLRFTMGRQTTEADIRQVVTELANLLR